MSWSQTMNFQMKGNTDSIEFELASAIASHVENGYFVFFLMFIFIYMGYPCTNQARKLWNNLGWNFKA